MASSSLLPEDRPIHRVDLHNEPQQQPGSLVATDDHDLIRAWAARHSAEPATGEATPSGPATRNVQDGGVGIRFNFPGAGMFRPITWDEWFQNFAAFDLIFVYERDTPGKTPMPGYRLVAKEKLQAREARV